MLTLWFYGSTPVLFPLWRIVSFQALDSASGTKHDLGDGAECSGDWEAQGPLQRYRSSSDPAPRSHSQNTRRCLRSLLLVSRHFFAFVDCEYLDESFTGIQEASENPASEHCSSRPPSQSSLEHYSSLVELWVSFATLINSSCFSNQSVSYSKSDSKLVNLITIPDGKDKKQYLKVYDLKEHIETLCVDLAGAKKHGVVHGKGGTSIAVMIIFSTIWCFGFFFRRRSYSLPGGTPVKSGAILRCGIGVGQRWENRWS